MTVRVRRTLIQAPRRIINELKQNPKYKNSNLTDEFIVYHAMIRSVDEGMERLVQAARNQTRETIFIFTSDNGAVAYEKTTNKKRTGCNYPLRGFKGRMDIGRLNSVFFQVFCTRKHHYFDPIG